MAWNGSSNQATSPASESLDTAINAYPEYRIGMSIQTVRPYLFSPLGIISNMISVYILSKKSMHSASITPYLLTIAVCDSIYLLTDLIDIPIGKLVVKTHSFCTLTYFICYASLLISDLIVAAVAVDRSLVIAYPHRAHLLSTPKKTCQVIFAAVIFEILVSAECFFTYTVDAEGRTCIRTGKASLRQAAALLILIHNIISWIVIFVSSCVIIHKLRAHHRMLVQLEMPQPNNNRKDRQIGTMLVSIAVLYIFTNLPIVCILLSAHFNDWYSHSAHDNAIFVLLYEIALVCKSLNHFLNFYLYCFSASIFKKEVIKLFKPCIPKRCIRRTPGTPIFNHSISRMTNITVFW